MVQIVVQELNFGKSVDDSSQFGGRFAGNHIDATLDRGRRGLPDCGIVSVCMIAIISNPKSIQKHFDQNVAHKGGTKTSVTRQLIAKLECQFHVGFDECLSPMKPAIVGYMQQDSLGDVAQFWVGAVDMLLS